MGTTPSKHAELLEQVGHLLNDEGEIQMEALEAHLQQLVDIDPSYAEQHMTRKRLIQVEMQKPHQDMRSDVVGTLMEPIDIGINSCFSRTHQLLQLHSCHDPEERRALETQSLVCIISAQCLVV
jgi:hypothetical protein